MPINNGKTMEQIFIEIARNHAVAMQNGKMLVSIFCDLSQNSQDQRLVRYFVECDGPVELLAAKSMSPAMQQARFQQTVNKISAKTLIPEESARRVCNAFWCAAGGNSMVPSVRQPEVVMAQPKTQAKADIPVHRQYAPAPPVQKLADCPKERFLMTEQEYENGGNFYVYYDDGTRELVHFPPNVQNYQPGLPRIIDGGSKVTVTKNKKLVYSYNVVTLQDYSDGRLANFVKTDFLLTLFMTVGVTAGYLLAIYVGIPAVLYLANWILEAVLPVDLLKHIDFSGFGLSTLAEYYKNTYIFPLENIWAWVRLALILFPLGIFSLFGYDIISESWDMRKKVRQEIQRRKNCPDR